MGRSRTETAETPRAKPEPREAARGSAEPRDESRLLDDVAAVVSLTAAAFTSVSFFAYQSELPNLNFAGHVGHGLADATMQALGYAAYLIPLYLVVVAIVLFRHAADELTVARSAAAVVLLLCAAVLLGVVSPPPALHPVTRAGGWLGGFLASILSQGFGTLGTAVIVGAMALLSFIFATRVSVSGLAGSAARGVSDGVVKLSRRGSESVREVREVVAPRPKPNTKREMPVTAAAPIIVLADVERKSAVAKRKPVRVQEELPFGDERYQMPPTRMLAAPNHADMQIDEDGLRKSSQVLEAKLADFGITGKVVEVRPGPVITTFDIEPAPGVKVNRITSLGDDLAMALRVPGVRILAPVPGKAVVGIEVANPRRDEVVLREMIEADEFSHLPSSLALALGKDTAGQPVAGDLARMPHLMIAGATGSGKSVAINGMIMSILFKASPRDVRFVMIDLKMLELSVCGHPASPRTGRHGSGCGSGAGHRRADGGRYRLMKHRGVRNICSCNHLSTKASGQAVGQVIELRELASDDDDDVVTPSPMQGDCPNGRDRRRARGSDDDGRKSKADHALGAARVRRRASSSRRGSRRSTSSPASS